MLKKGDRVKHRWGKGTVYYYVSSGSVMVVFDKVISLGHDGNGGCVKHKLPKQPQWAGRCHWFPERVLEPIVKYDLVEEACSSLEIL